MPDTLTDNEIYQVKEWLTMLRWNLIWPKAVAKAWSDEAFKAKLLSRHPHVVRDAMKNDLGYELPEMMELSVVTESESGEAADDFSPAQMAIKKNLVPLVEGDRNMMAFLRRVKKTETGEKKTEVTMVLPDREGYDEDSAVAIVEYMEEGRTYPFTCL